MLQVCNKIILLEVLFWHDIWSYMHWSLSIIVCISKEIRGPPHCEVPVLSSLTEIHPPIFSSCFEMNGEFSHSLARKHLAKIRELSSAVNFLLGCWLRYSDKPGPTQANE